MQRYGIFIYIDEMAASKSHANPSSKYHVWMSRKSTRTPDEIVDWTWKMFVLSNEMTKEAYIEIVSDQNIPWVGNASGVASHVVLDAPMISARAAIAKTVKTGTESSKALRLTAAVQRKYSSICVSRRPIYCIWPYSLRAYHIQQRTWFHYPVDNGNR